MIVRVTPFGWVQWSTSVVMDRVAPGGWLQAAATVQSSRPHRRLLLGIG